MSVTTTQNSRITGLRRILADHELHHSDPTADEAEPAPRPNAQLQSIESNPPDWEGRWRRVPAYRPVQDQRGEQHDTYTGAVERNFVRVMFGGVSAMASASQIWRSTGGRLKSDYFMFKIGGEW